MKIDYELVDKIGATHYYELSRGGYVLINIDSAKLTNIDASRFDIKQFISVNDDGSTSDAYRVSASLKFLLSNAKPIPPKPPVRVEYEKVSKDTISIEDLMRELLDGVHFYNGEHCGGHYPIQTVLRKYIERSDSLYRRIEKPVDLREEFIEKVGDILPVFDKRTNPMWAGKLYDAGCRFVGLRLWTQ